MANVIRRGSPAYWMYEIPNFLTPEECISVRDTANRAGMHKSEVYGASSDSVDNASRLSFTAWLKPTTSKVIRKINRLTSQLTGYPEENQEDVQVLRYPEGGFFKPHYDCCEGGPEECSRMNALGGPRRITLIVYLNDGYEGGETFFPNIGESVVPVMGKAAVFWSTDAENNIITQSFHGGNPVHGGEKWICNKWVHAKPYRV